MTWAVTCVMLAAGVFVGAAVTRGGWPTAPEVYLLTGVFLGAAICILAVAVLA